MPVTDTLKDAEQKLIALKLPAIIRQVAANKQLRLSTISKLMHKNHTFLVQRLLRKQLNMPILFVLSQHLETNLFEPYTNLLPQEVSATAREKQLQQQITDLQKQMDDLRKERDFLKEIVMK